MEKVFASIVVSTRNRKKILLKSLNAMMSQDFKGGYEIIVVDDDSSDETFAELKKISSKNPLLKVFKNKRHSGPATARNLGIKNSRGKIIVVMDDDCIPEKNWLKNLVFGLKSEKIGVCSSFDYWGGTSTAYKKNVLEEIGLFNEDYPTNFREDTDTIFRVLDLGYKVKVLKQPFFKHFHKQPSTLKEKIVYALKRTWVHRVDPLLYKNHPERTKSFLDIKFGFIRNPIKDFENAVGLWWKKSFDLKLGSPQGVTLIENKSFLHTTLIVLLGLVYVVLVKLARLYGSIRYGKLLV